MRHLSEVQVFPSVLCISNNLSLYLYYKIQDLVFYPHKVTGKTTQ